ncbi:hypothetical protein ACM66B_005990 [Microbotryomycetes sp. NB124-2]
MISESEESDDDELPLLAADAPSSRSHTNQQRDKLHIQEQDENVWIFAHLPVELLEEVLDWLDSETLLSIFETYEWRKSKLVDSHAPFTSKEVISSDGLRRKIVRGSSGDSSVDEDAVRDDNQS